MLAVLIIFGMIFYLVDAVMNPEKHMFGLIILAILYAIFGSFYETTGAKADYNRKKKG